MKKGVIIGIASGLLLAISMWLPAVKSGNTTHSFMERIEFLPDTSGLIWGIVIVGLAMALLAFLNKKGTNIVGIVVAIIALMLSALLMTGAQEDGDPGMGIYTMLIASVGSVVGFIMSMIGNRKAS